MSLAHETILHIDLAKLKSNFQYLCSQLSKETKVIAVVKAHAYGLGGYEIANFLETLGVQNFWVADFEEGVSLREQGIKGNIIIANPGYLYVYNIGLCNTGAHIFL